MTARMAAAFKKLFKSSDRISDEGATKGSAGSDSPGHHSAARRFFGHVASPRNSRREAKVAPAEGGPPLPVKVGGSSQHGSRSKSSSKSSSGVMVDSVVKHNQAVRTRRLMKEYQEICKSCRGVENPPFIVELVDDNLYEWNVKLFQVDPESDFYRDMQETGLSYVLLNVTFPDNFPFAPPFMRVLSPHIEKGFVMEGGAICMELLTPRGWASAYTMEAVIMQFAASLVKGQGRIARKCKSGKEFNRKLAEASFRSLVKTHEKYGWVTPPLADG